ncbi:MAG: 4Fe-4S dicluster domain-containing protein [Gemmatimonadaceae bacterium]
MTPRDDETSGALGRRDFLRVAGASVALAGIDACARLPVEHILPYVDDRPELTPNVGRYYATAMQIDGYATGLVVRSHDGRPTKIEGNPQHPASLGASGPMHQASLMQLYDPDRASVARSGSTRTTWAAIAAALAPAVLRQRVGARGEGLRLLLEPTSSPLDEELIARVFGAYPGASVHLYAPLMPEIADMELVQHYDIASADVIVAVDSDFLAAGPFHLRYARQFADGRRLASPTDPMNRLYAVESTYTPTGAAADHRFVVRPRDLPSVLGALHTAVTTGAAASPAWVGAVARDLVEHRGRAVVVGGDMLPPSLRTIVDAINAAIGASGKTTWYAPSPLIGRRIPLRPFAELIAALQHHAVDTLIVVGGNPSYTTPASLGFSALLRGVADIGYLGLYENETARDARWFVPLSHYLESWGDARAYDGTLSIVQPLIRRLYDSVSPPELYAAIAGAPVSPGGDYDLLRASWAARTSGDAEAAWSNALQRGIVSGTADTTRSAAAPPSSNASAVPHTPADGTIDVIYAADPKVHDGAYSNNGWLQELAAPITKLTWGNAALLSPRTAARIGVSTGDALVLSSGDRHLRVAAFLVPGHADDAVTLTFGYGRAGKESLARGVGANAYELWPARGVRFELDVRAVKDAKGAAPRFVLAQSESMMKVSEPVRRATLAEYRRSPNSVGDRSERMLSLYPEPAPPGGQPLPNQWAMTIDLGTCIGCGACTIACQAENNIPVVGADEVSRGRAMEWIRIDRYFTESEEALFQPMLCQHCEHAPCEYVCPVEATVHSADGLNEMIYNRCVGTRFCSNNCPYKVRRFNWHDYNHDLSPTEIMVKNPNVTVRERGVMEKCTFCVQRIREAEIAAGREGRDLRGSDVRTACQQACPTNAIVFGSLADVDSEMMRRRGQPRAYAVLRELGTEPRVRYLARIHNPNSGVGPYS